MPEPRRYRLTVSGIVEFSDQDKALEELLLGKRGENGNPRVRGSRL